MKVAVLGANGQVGTDVCFFLRDASLEVAPIVRNAIAAAYLRHNGFDCRIAALDLEEDARHHLADIDAVVIAGYATDLWGVSRRTRRTNEKILANTVRFSKPDAKILNMSSIRAYSRAIDKSRGSVAIPASYDWDKRHLERVVSRQCQLHGKRGYSFRLGHVFGSKSLKTTKIQDILSRNKVALEVAPERLSNAVHTVTIAEAVLICCMTDIVPGLYSLVNHPQWTWKNVFDYYNTGGTELLFSPRRRGRRYFRLRNRVFDIIPIVKDWQRGYLFLRMFLPVAADEVAQRHFFRLAMKSDISRLQNPYDRVFMHEFGYEPIPGRTLPGLTPTSLLLERQAQGQRVLGPEP